MLGFSFLRCLGSSLVSHGIPGLLQQVPLAPSLYAAVSDALKQWREGRHQRALREEIEAAASLGAEEVRKAAAEAAREAAAGQPKEVELALELYLSQVPAALRRSLSRPDDPSGKTVPSGYPIDQPEYLKDMLPQQQPRFRPGDRPKCLGDNWELVELLGTGGFGEVWKGRQVDFHTVAAFKFCLDPVAQERLLKHEGTVVSQVQKHGKHPGVVALEDANLQSDPPWLRYEFVPDGDLTRVFAELKPLSVADRAKRVGLLLRDLAAIVGHFHRLNPSVVHRDLKPANILLDGASIRVADFGIGAVSAERLRSLTGGSTPSIQFGLTIGTAHTPLYASPQHKRGEPADPRDDVFALGVIGYQLLISDITAEAPRGAAWKKRLAEQGVPAGLLAVIEECVEDDAAERPNDGATLAEKLSPPAATSPQTQTSPVPVPSPVLPDVTIAPIKVNAPVAAVPQVASGILPRIPHDVLALEGQLAGLEETLKQLRESTHPNLQAGLSAVREAELRADAVARELDEQRRGLGEETRSLLTARFRSAPDTPVADLCDLVPRVPIGSVIVVIQHLRVRAAFEAERNKEVNRLQSDAEKVRADLIARQEDDLKSALSHWFTRVGGSEFPLTEWPPIETALRERRFRFDTGGAALLRRAEMWFKDHAFRTADKAHWEKAERENTEEGYAFYRDASPRGKYVDESRKRQEKLKADTNERKKKIKDEAGAALDRERWAKAERLDSADGYEEYVAVTGKRGGHYKEANERLSSRLRTQLLADLRNAALRQRYLRHRTTEHKELDASSAPAGPVIAARAHDDGSGCGVFLAIVAGVLGIAGGPPGIFILAALGYAIGRAMGEVPAVEGRIPTDAWREFGPLPPNTLPDSKAITAEFMTLPGQDPSRVGPFAHWPGCCPKCGFSHAWTGKSCSHCKYPNA